MTLSASACRDALREIYGPTARYKRVDHAGLTGLQEGLVTR